MPAITVGSIVPGKIASYHEGWVAPSWNEPPPLPAFPYSTVDIRGVPISREMGGLRNIVGPVPKKPSTVATLKGALKSVYTSDAIAYTSEEDTMNCKYGIDPCGTPETVKQARARLKGNVKGAKAALKRFDADQKAQRKTQADRELALTTIRELTNHRHAGPVRIDAAQKLLNL